jgi:hypothetical protein
LVEQTASDEDLAAGKGEGVDEIRVGEKMKMPGEFTFGMRSHMSSNHTNVLLQSAALRRLDRRFRCVTLCKLIANLRLFWVGETSEVHGNAGRVVFPICHHVHDGIGADSVLPGSVLREIESARGH